MRHADLADAPAVLPDVPALLRARRGIEVRQIADVLHAVRRKQDLVQQIAPCFIRLVVAPAVKPYSLLGYRAIFIFMVVGHRHLKQFTRCGVNAVARGVIIAAGIQIARGDGKQDRAVLFTASVNRLLCILSGCGALGHHVKNILLVIVSKVNTQACSIVARPALGIHFFVCFAPHFILACVAVLGILIVIPGQHLIHNVGVLELRRIDHGVILTALLHGHGHSVVLFEQGSRIIRGTDLLERDLLRFIGAVVVAYVAALHSAAHK